MKFRDVLEGKVNVKRLNESNVMSMAESQGAEATDALRKHVNEKLGIKADIPKIKTNNFSAFASQYNSLYNQFKKEFISIFNYEVKGIGRGEILLSYLADNISINGGKGDYDVNFGNTKMEVKEVATTATYFKNFRLGVLSREYLQKAYNDIKYLYGVAKYHIPEINTAAFEAKVAKGELTTLIKPLKDFVPTNLGDVQRIAVEITKTGKLFFEGREVGNIKNAQAIITDILDKETHKFKSFNMIETELRNNLNKKTMPYIFFGDNKGKETAMLFYRKDLGDLEIDTITQGNVKVKIPR